MALLLTTWLASMTVLWGGLVHSFDGGSVQVDSIVDDKEGVVVVHDVVVDADSVQVLLEEDF